MRPRRTLVTGSSGFIGTRLVQRLAAEGGQVMLLDRTGGQDVTGAIRHSVKEFAPDQCFHLAAVHMVEWCREHPAETMATNVGGTINVLDALAETDCRAVVLASSAAVYGFGDGRFWEGDELRPADIYGQSKLEAERVLAEYAMRRPGASCKAARLFNVVGAGDMNDHLLPQLARSRVAGTFGRAGNTWPTRDYVNVDDVVSALLVLARADSPGYRAYNVCTGDGTSVGGLIRMVRDSLVDGLPTGWTVDLLPGRENDGHLVGDPSRLRDGLGWRAGLSVRESVDEALRWEMSR